MATKTSTRDQAFTIRATAQQRDLIDRAAEALATSRSEFILEIACREAERVLLDRAFFHVDGDTFDRFTALLDAPLPPTPALRRLLQTPAPWE